MSQCCSCLAAAQFARCRPVANSGAAGAAATAAADGFAVAKRQVAGLRKQASRLWSNLNETRKSLCEDVGQWGIGPVPIFTIVVSSNGRLQVRINEQEICGRCALQSVLSRHKVDAAQQLARARKLARDIEQGLFQPPATSILYRFVTEEQLASPFLVLHGRETFVLAGLALGIAVSIVLFLQKPRKKRPAETATASVVDIGTTSRSQADKPAEKSELSSEKSEVTKTMLKIRDMAKQAALEDEDTYAESEEDLVEPLQYAAAVRSHFLRSKYEGRATSNEEALPSLDVNRENLQPETTAGQDVQSQETVVLKGSGDTSSIEVKEETQSNQAAELNGHAKPKTKPRIITSYVEAREVLSNKGTSGHLKYVPNELSESSTGQTEAADEAIPSLAGNEKTGEEEEVNSIRQTIKSSSSIDESHGKDQASTEADFDGQAEQIAKPRIITSYAEAREVLAARKKKTTSPKVVPENSDTNELPSSFSAPMPSSFSAPLPSSFSAADDSVKAKTISANTPQSSTASAKPKRKRRPRTTLSEGPATKEKKSKTVGSTSDARNSKEPRSPRTNTLGVQQVAPEAEMDKPAKIATVRKETSEGATAAVQKYLANKAAGIEERPKEGRTITTGNADRGEEPSLPKNDKKVWHTDLKRRYDREKDPKMRALIREFGADLESWIPEDEVKEMLTLNRQGIEGKRELLRRWYEEGKDKLRRQGEVVGEEEADKMFKRYEKINDRIEKQIAMFGPRSMERKYRDYNPPKPDYLWWFELRYVACVFLRNDEKESSGGLFSMNMAKGENEEPLNHVIAFEEQQDALNFCKILVPTLDEEVGGETGSAVVSYEPKKLFREAGAAGYKVTVMKKGQLELYAGKPLYEVQDRILELGRDYYVQERLRKNSIDFSAVMEDLGRGL